MALLLCLQMTEYTQSIPELRISFLRSFVLSFAHVIDYALMFSIVNFNKPPILLQYLLRVSQIFTCQIVVDTRTLFFHRLHGRYQYLLQSEVKFIIIKT